MKDYHHYHHSGISSFKDNYRRSSNFKLRSNYFIDFEDDNNISKDWLGNIIKNQNLSEILGNIKKRGFQRLAQMKSNKIKVFSGFTENRLLLGLGNSHIKETSLNFHHIYGVPFIPGSSLKGICRHYIISRILNIEKDDELNLNCLDKLLELEVSEKITPNQEWIKEKTAYKVKDKTTNETKKFVLSDKIFEEAEKYFQIEKGKALSKEEKENEKRATWEDLWFARNIFGTQENAGKIVFHDSFPFQCKLELDIMNPHYGKYYSDEKNNIPPADYLTPVPIKFLAIPKKVKFYFTVSNTIRTNSNEIILVAQMWLQDALDKVGVGAKTAVGYGYFTNFKDEEEELKKAELELLTESEKELKKIEDGDSKTISNCVKKIKSITNNEEKQKLINTLLKLFTNESLFIKSSEANSLSISSLGFYIYIKENENAYSEEQLHKILKLIKKYASRNFWKKIKKDSKLLNYFNQIKSS